MLTTNHKMIDRPIGFGSISHDEASALLRYATLCQAVTAMKLSGAKSKNGKKWHAKALLIDPHKTKIVFAESSIRQRECHVPPWIYRRFLGEQPEQEIGEGTEVPVDPGTDVASCFPKGGSITVFNVCADGEK
jgi:hypothetical protein